MAQEFVTVGDSSVSLATITHVTFHGTEATVYVVGGAAIPVTGDDVEAVAKAVGRKPAKQSKAADKT